MRPALRIAAWIAAVLASLLVVLTAASLIFNATTSGEGKPVRALWTGQLVETDGRLTAYRTWGSHGPPVVLIGGFVEPTFVWNAVARRLARTHRVYALDLDGFGYTERRGPWTLAVWGDQVQAFLRRLGIVRPIVVGHSLGAAVAVELARRELASRVVLLDGDATMSGGPPWFVRTVVARTPFVISGLRLANRWDWPVKRILANAYGPHHPPLDHAMVQRWTEQFEVEGAENAFEEMARRSPPGFHRSALKDADSGDRRVGRRGRRRSTRRGPPDGRRPARALRARPGRRASLDAHEPRRGRTGDRTRLIRTRRIERN